MSYVWDNEGWDDNGQYYIPGFRIMNEDTGEIWDSLVSFIASFDFELEGSEYGMRTYVFGPIHQHVYGY